MLKGAERMLGNWRALWAITILGADFLRPNYTSGFSVGQIKNDVWSFLNRISLLASSDD